MKAKVVKEAPEATLSSGTGDVSTTSECCLLMLCLFFLRLLPLSLEGRLPYVASSRKDQSHSLVAPALQGHSSLCCAVDVVILALQACATTTSMHFVPR